MSPSHFQVRLCEHSAGNHAEHYWPTFNAFACQLLIQQAGEVFLLEATWKTVVGDQRGSGYQHP